MTIDTILTFWVIISHHHAWIAALHHQLSRNNTIVFVEKTKTLYTAPNGGCGRICRGASASVGAAGSPSSYENSCGNPRPKGNDRKQQGSKSRTHSTLSLQENSIWDSRLTI
jgi:hypothetical protein